MFVSNSVDGYFTDVAGSMSWAHRRAEDSEWQSYIERNARGNATLLFGRKTYEMMVAYWPTPMAAQTDPLFAERMNTAHKVVFSRTMESADWRNTRLVRTDAVEEVRTMKEEPGEDLVILGSGSLVAQLAATGLIDEFQIVIVPVALGAGRTIFDGLDHNIELSLTESRAFKNGNVFVRYEPVR